MQGVSLDQKRFVVNFLSKARRVPFRFRSEEIVKGRRQSHYEQT
jgi:hypothetical protein